VLADPTIVTHASAFGSFAKAGQMWSPLSFSDRAVAGSLTQAVGSADADNILTVLGGRWPETPFVAVIDAETTSVELVGVTDVTTTSGVSTLQVLRGWDGLSPLPPQAHALGAVMEAVVNALDAQGANAHVTPPRRLPLCDLSLPVGQEPWPCRSPPEVHGERARGARRSTFRLS